MTDRESPPGAAPAPEEVPAPVTSAVPLQPAPSARPFAEGQAPKPKRQQRAVTPRQPPTDQSGRALIRTHRNPYLQHEYDAVLAEVLWTLSNASNFVGPSGDRLVHVKDDGSGLLDSNAVDLQIDLSRFATFFQVIENSDGEERIIEDLKSIPIYIKGALETKEFPDMDQIISVKRSPFFAVEGDERGRPIVKLIQEFGYHAPSKSFYHPHPTSTNISVPENPTQADAKTALYNLRYPVRDFPFTGDEMFSAWVALLLSVFLRDVLGAVPMFLVGAAKQGTGKSLLLELASVIATGEIPAFIKYSQDGEEFRKALGATVMEGGQLIGIDNITGVFDSAALATLLTGTGKYKDRILGESKNIEIDNKAVVAGTGNNCVLGDDMIRRVIPIEMVANVEKPEERSGFTEVRLLDYVRETRAQYAAAVLTIALAYLQAAQRGDVAARFELKDMGSFESFSLVRKMILFAGGADPLAARISIGTKDTGTDLLFRLLMALKELDPNNEGLTTGQIIEHGTKTEGVMAKSSKGKALREVLDELKPASGKITPVWIGRKLNGYVNQVAGDYSLRSRVVNHQNTFFVEKLS